MTPETLQHLRKQRMLTREELAKELGCSASAIVHWEGGARDIPDWVAEKMYRTLPIEFTIDELAELYEIAKDLGIGLHQLFAQAVRPLIADRIAKRQNIIPIDLDPIGPRENVNYKEPSKKRPTGYTGGGGGHDLSQVSEEKKED